MTSPVIEQEPSSRSGSSSNEDDQAELAFDSVTSRRPPPKKQKREQPVPFEALQQAGCVISDCCTLLLAHHAICIRASDLLFALHFSTRVTHHLLLCRGLWYYELGVKILVCCTSGQSSRPVIVWRGGPGSCLTHC